MDGLKNINGYSIYKEGTWCVVTKEGKHIYDGSVEEKMTHEDIYKILAIWIVFKLNGKELISYSSYGSYAGEKESALQLLAYENNCSIEDIEVSEELR